MVLFFALKSFNNFCRFSTYGQGVLAGYIIFCFVFLAIFFSGEPNLMNLASPALFPKVSFSPNFSYSCLL